MYLAKILTQIINAFTAVRGIFTALMAARKFLKSSYDFLRLYLVSLQHKNSHAIISCIMFSLFYE